MTRTKGVAASPGDRPGLAARAARGDRDAFAALYAEHVERTFRYLRFRVGDGGVAADLTQDVWLQAYAAIGSLRDPDRFDAWLLAIARNRLRRHWARRGDGEEPLEAADGSRQQADADPPGSALTPEGDLDVVLEGEHLARAVAGLSDARREVVALRFGAGYSVKETAALLGKREAAVKQLQHRALLDLRAQLHHEETDA